MLYQRWHFEFTSTTTRPAAEKELQSQTDLDNQHRSQLGAFPLTSAQTEHHVGTTHVTSTYHQGGAKFTKEGQKRRVNERE